MLRYKPPTPTIEGRATKVCQYKCNAVWSALIPSSLSSPQNSLAAKSNVQCRNLHWLSCPSILWAPHGASSIAASCLAHGKSPYCLHKKCPLKFRCFALRNTFSSPFLDELRALVDSRGHGRTWAAPGLPSLVCSLVPRRARGQQSKCAVAAPPASSAQGTEGLARSRGSSSSGLVCVSSAHVGSAWSASACL